MPDSDVEIEAGVRIERFLAEDRARDLCRDIEIGQAPNAEVIRLGSTIALRNPESERNNVVFLLANDQLEVLPELLRRYEGQSVKPTFFVRSSGFSAELGKHLILAGFYPASFEQALLYRRPEQTPVEPPEPITVEPTTSENIEVSLDIMAEGFAWHKDWRDEVADYYRRKLTHNNYRGFLARYEAQPAGVGIIALDDDFAFLRDGTVLPKYRRRGCHIALLNRRLKEAYLRGCTMVGGGTGVRSASFRNHQRVGFHVAYVESRWTWIGREGS